MVGEAWQWISANGPIVWGTVAALVALWGSGKAIHLKLFESVAELNEARRKLAWAEATEKLGEQIEDGDKLVERIGKEMAWSEANLMSLSSDKKKRAAAREVLEKLEPPSYIKEKGLD